MEQEQAAFLQECDLGSGGCLRNLPREDTGKVFPCNQTWEAANGAFLVGKEKALVVPDTFPEKNHLPDV